MNEVPALSLIVTEKTLKLAKKIGIVNTEWNGTYLTKDRLHAFIRVDHEMYVNVHLVTSQEKFPLWTYRIDVLKNASKIENHSGFLWFPFHYHGQEEFEEYHDAYEAGLAHALKLIDK